MTKDEAARVMRLICRPYNVAIDDALLQVWWDAALERSDYDTGLSVARDLVKHNTFMPRPAEFNTLMRRRTDPMRDSIAAIGPGDSWKPNRELAARMLGEMRATVRGTKEKS